MTENKNMEDERRGSVDLQFAICIFQFAILGRRLLYARIQTKGCHYDE
jgi:hypothetical protein